MAILLRQILADCGLSQADLARRLGYTKRQVCACCGGHVSGRFRSRFFSYLGGPDDGAALIRAWLRERGQPPEAVFGPVTGETADTDAGHGSLILREALIACEITHPELAALVGYNTKYLTQVLGGLARVSPYFRRRISAFLAEDNPKANLIRGWLNKHKTPITSVCRHSQTRRSWNTTERHRRRCGYTMDRAMAPGDPAHWEPHKEALMISFKTMRHFKLRRNPFFNEIAEVSDIFLSEDHIFIKEMMSESAKHRGFVAVYGEVGCGKSTMRKALYKELADEGIRMIYPVILDKSRISASSLLDAIVMDISDEGPKRSLEAKTRQAIRLLKNRQANGFRQVMIIEEAHRLNIYALRALKQIYEFEDGYNKLLGVVLIGQPELAGKLDETQYPQLREVIRRVTVAEIEGLNQRDLPRYIAHKLARVNAGVGTVLADDACAALSRRLSSTNGNGAAVSRAYPLSINNLLVRAMNMACELGEPLVTAEIVNSL